MRHRLGAPAVAAFICLCAVPSWADDKPEAPLSDTDESTLNTVDVGPGWLHAMAAIDVANGDFVRGVYDGDGAGINRLPFHARLSVVAELAHDAKGKPTTWLEARSSNGFHDPTSEEPDSPHAWYETNNLIGIAHRIAPDLIGAVTYTIKTAPNGGSDTTHELSGALGLSGDKGLAALRPGLAVTWRPKGGGGLFTQATLEPGLSLGTEDTRLSFPTAVGVGWRSFYDQGTGNRVYGATGLSLRHSFAVAGGHMVARAEAQALFRDNRLRRLDGPDTEHHTTEPSVTVSLAYAY